MSPQFSLSDYLKKLHEVHSHGDAREESFYPVLRDLLADFARSTGRQDAHVTIQPSPTEAGNPDLRVWNGTDAITGYIEAKAPSTHRLGPIEESEQLERYLETFPNLILTNFFEFRLYRDGEMVDRALAAQPGTLTDVGATPPAEDTMGVYRLLERFFSFSLPEPVSAEDLAVELARRTRFFRDIVKTELQHPDADSNLQGFHRAFQKFLIGSLSREQFADLYAQTVTYGLFAARTRTTGTFSRRVAFDAIPHTIGVLRNVFRYISLQDPPDEIEWIVDDIAHCLSAADPGELLRRYFEQDSDTDSEGRGSDPIVHFYETFLAEYDPEARKQRGFFCTPDPVVGYIIRSLHSLLKDRFGKTEGLASSGVTALDPAAGTMTFMARASRTAVEEFETRFGAGGTETFVREHILENFYAFELMMAPYAVGHMKMGFVLDELGHRLAEDERFKFYLTNSLEVEELEQTQFPIMSSLAEESQLAGEVKRNKPILVIFGNPPYFGHSSNKGKWIRNRIEDYKQVDGQPLGERNPKWLQDDYVKFLRFAQWKIEQVPRGMVGMITNHSYLDNPTFRGMRQSLMETFDEIHVLDLHGNSLKRETCPDGSKDENVFDIRQGVAIAFFVKTGEDAGPATVYHHDLWGLREDKYNWLRQHDIDSTDWDQIAPKSEFYLFQPRDEAALDRYNEFDRVTDLFPVNSVGIVTSRDGFVIDIDRDRLERRVRQFRDANMPDELIEQAFDLHDNRTWNLHEAREAVRADEGWQDKLVRCLYRPFDERWLFYEPPVIERGREEVMRHMLAGTNLALITMRQVALDEPYTHALVTRTLTDNRTFLSSKGITQHIPLYLYPETSKNNIFNHLPENGDRRPNLAPELLPALQNAHGTQPTPEEVFHYVYAVLCTTAYRDKYAEFLKFDFPRVPFTTDGQLFREVAELGQRLVALHLLDSPEIDPPLARFEGKGDCRVARRKSEGFRYEEKTERKYINQTQYFAPVPLELWEYQVGGYQVLRKWLKDRKDRELSTEEIRTYCRIVTALRTTIDVQEELDALYPRVEEDIIEMELGS